MTVVPGAVSLLQSVVTAIPASIASGSTATVTLTALDAYGNQEQSGGLSVVFGLAGGSASGTFGAITDNHNGTYTATFTGLLAGSNTITATIGGQAVTSAPAPITVVAGPVSLAQSIVSVVPGSIQAGQNTTVTLQARDFGGNYETSGGLNVAFSLGAGSAGGTFGAVTDNHNGTYSAVFFGNLAGVSSVAASINAQLVTAPAPTITVTPGPLSLAVSAVTLTPTTIAAGGTTSVTLTAEDAFGNQVPTSGLSVAFNLAAGSVTGAFGVVTDNHNGTYTATFTAGPNVGSSAITATIGGIPITSLAPTLTVHAGAVNLADSSLSIDSSSIASGSAATVTLIARDSFGNQENTGGLNVGFDLGGGSATGTFAPTIDHQNGVYTAVFTGVLAGTNTIAATIVGNAFTSPLASIAVTAGPVSPNESFITSAPASIQAGASDTVTLHTEDAAGNVVPIGGASVSFGLGAGSASGTFGAVTDFGDGTYTAAFTGASAGTNTVTAVVNSQGVTTASPTVTVTAGSVSTSASIVSVFPAAIPAGGTTTVILTAKDAFGNPETSGGLTVALGLGSTSIHGAFSNVTDNGNGTYSAIFTAGPSVGSSPVAATIAGAAVTSAPPTLTVTPAVFSPSQSTFSVVPSSIASGSSTVVTLIARDRFGNQEAIGGLSVTFGLGSGAATGTFSATTDDGNGVYTAAFTGALDGTSTITAAIDGQAVTSAAPTVAVTPGPVSAAQSIITIVPAALQVGGGATVTLQAKDAAGNSETSGGLAVVFSLAAGAATGTFGATTDNGNGTYSAVFTGDTTGSSVVAASINSVAVTSTLPIVTVNQGNTTATLTANPTAAAVFGQNVTFTVAVAPVVSGFGTPTGTVTFYDGATLLGSNTLNGSGMTTLSVSGLGIGKANISASYVGDTQFAASTGSLSYSVSQAATTTVVTAAPAGSEVFGQAVTFSATVSVASPSNATVPDGGLVTFKDGAATLGTGTLTGGVATFTTSNLIDGKQTITAQFGNETNFAASVGALNGTAANNFTVAKAGTTTTATASLPVSALGQTVSLSASVAANGPSAAPINSGFVKFMQGAISLNGPTGTPVTSGVATFATSGLLAGIDSITAIYSGAGNFNGSSASAPLVQDVYQANLNVTSSLAGGSVYGQPVTFTANMTSTPLTTGTLAGGLITFVNGATVLGTGVVTGSVTSYTASLTTTVTPTVQLAAGADKIYVDYDLATLGASAPKSLFITQNVGAAHAAITLTIPGSSFFGQPVTFSAAVSAAAPSAGVPIGAVVFKDGKTVLGTGVLNASGVATFTTTNLVVGNHSITASLATTPNFAAGSSAAQNQAVSVASTQTAVVSSVNASALGQPVTLTATVTAAGGGSATGVVTFYDGAKLLGKGTLNASGVATYTTTATQLALGADSITAVYAAAAKSGFTGSSSPAYTQVVNAVSTVTTLTASPNNWSVGAPITFTATVAATTGLIANGGTVTFIDSLGNVLGTANVVNGKAVLNFAGFTSVGIHSVTASYNGTARLPGRASPVPRSPRTLVLVAASASADPATLGVPAVITFYISGDGGVPVGSLSVYDGKRFLGTIYLNSFGIATITLSNLAVGTHDITAVYSGDTEYSAATTGTPLPPWSSRRAAPDD